jgi:hypothetical protein
MPKKLLTAIVVFLFATPIYFQITRVRAEHDPITHPLTPPITSEITPTVTPTNTPTMTPTTTPTLTPTNTPTSTPTSTPTATVTPTVTPTPSESPEDDGTIAGKVIYRKLGPLPNNTPRASDAAGVDITVEGFFGGGEVASDTTDANGMYAVDVPPGFYKVTVDDETSVFFTPPLRFVRVAENQTRQADFQGLLFPTF